MSIASRCITLCHIASHWVTLGHIWPLSRLDVERVRVCGPHAERVDDDVDAGDDEDDDGDDVIDDLGRPDLRLLVDVEVADDDEQDPDDELEKSITFRNKFLRTEPFTESSFYRKSFSME